MFRGPVEVERAVEPVPRADGMVVDALDVVLVGPQLYAGPTSFIDVGRLQRTLENDGVTGFVRVTGPDYGALALLVAGRTLAARFDDDREGPVSDLLRAQRSTERRAREGDGGVSVVALDRDRAQAAVELLTGTPLVTGLLGRFADLDGLLDYLAELVADASLVVHAPSGTAVLLFAGGSVHTTFLRGRAVPGRMPAEVRVLARDLHSRIEVAADARWTPGRPPVALPPLVLSGRPAFLRPAPPVGVA